MASGISRSGWPIGKALGRAVQTVVGRFFGGAEQRHAGVLEQVAEREAELRRLEGRLLEIEERFDFAERLLASGRPAPGPEADTPPEPMASVR
jgi:hypothetical protein